ncbi:hypothetical protein [Siphonobacter curvatus]|uniref:Uncharacterized protein n=1 Tax=Siphonobacter curvatus TaxID=2094562 RepID=A0A2S7IL23_9BACT|nr:hypothetical protein [Siphonobacter curvatus]PQA58356.1 hypothetical protein C5O19_01385 [Siphonobacter curvatus]
MKKILLLFLVLLSIIISCKNDNISLEDFNDKNKNNEIERFKEALKVQLSKNIDANNYIKDYNISWSMSLKKYFANGKVYLQVPIQNTKKEDRLFYYNDLKKSIKAPDLQILYYKDSLGQEILQLMEMLPDVDYARKHGEFTEDFSFSGLQLFRDLDGKLMNGYRFKDGKRISKVFPGVSNGRINGEVCIISYRQYYTASCFNASGIIVKGTNVLYTNQTGPIAPGCPYEQGYTCFCYVPTDSPEVLSEVCTYIPDDPTNPGTGTGSIALKELEVDKLKLLGPCPGLNNWRNLVIQQPENFIKNKLAALPSYTPFTSTIPTLVNVPGDWYVHAISNAEGVAINLDEYSVYLDDLPMLNGHRMSIAEFSEYIRLHINDFVDNSKATFNPHSQTGHNESAIWNSSNPLGAIISIAIPGDYGSVITTGFSPGGFGSAGWTFSTIHDPWNGDHPVSGNRYFGVYEQGSGYVVFTQGADRITNYLGSLMGWATNAANGTEFQFTQSDILWKSFQSKISQFANTHGTSSQIRAAKQYTPNWNKIKEALQSNKSLDTVPCNN